MNKNNDRVISENYEVVMREVNEKIGERPTKPADLESGNWSDQAIKVLKERYVKENTIMVNLQNQKYFKRDKESKYHLVDEKVTA